MRGTNGNTESENPRRGRWSEAERARLQELYGLRDDQAIARELNRPVASVIKMAEKLFPPVVEARPWTPEDIEQLKHYLGASSVDVVARVMRRSIEDVQEQINGLDGEQDAREWTREEVAEFKRIYGTRVDEDLVRIFGRALSAVEELAARFALAKDKAFLRRLQGNASTRMPRWSSDEVELLKREYPMTPNVQLANELGRSLKSVVSKAHNLGLKKSPDRLKAMGRENVSLRYHPERIGHDRDFQRELPPVEDVHTPAKPVNASDEPAVIQPAVEPAAEPALDRDTGEPIREVPAARPERTEPTAPAPSDHTAQPSTASNAEFGAEFGAESASEPTVELTPAPPQGEFGSPRTPTTGGTSASAGDPLAPAGDDSGPVEGDG